MRLYVVVAACLASTTPSAAEGRSALRAGYALVTPEFSDLYKRVSTEASPTETKRLHGLAFALGYRRALSSRWWIDGQVTALIGEHSLTTQRVGLDLQLGASVFVGAGLGAHQLWMGDGDVDNESRTDFGPLGYAEITTRIYENDGSIATATLQLDVARVCTRRVGCGPDVNDDGDDHGETWTMASASLLLGLEF